MCGIAGILSKNTEILEEITKLNDCLSHRGPDANGVWKTDNIALAHNRLSIIDLSENGAQPMHSADGNWCMVFNGEVYNFNELKRKYHLSNLKSQSDSEVILEIIAKNGIQALQEFNGMFAIAIYHKIKNELILARDRIGVKPIYYYWDKENFIFASELKALKKSKIISANLTINKSAIYDYLHLGYIPAPKSIYNKINKLGPGEILSLKNNQVKIEKYWLPEEKIQAETITNEKEAELKLDELLNNSVALRLISDVPLACFLSGGVDSSLVSAIAQKQSADKINTFSIGFAESKYNELPYARKVAQIIAAEHTEYTVNQQDAKDLIFKLPHIYDEPFSDTSAIPSLLVSQLAKRKVSVALSGDGGDELFMGYGAYKWAKRLNNPIIKYNRNIIAAFLNNANKRAKRAAMLFSYQQDDDLNAHIFSQEQYLFSQKELANLLQQNGKFEFSAAPTKRKLSPAEKQALFDLKYYLPDDLLVKVDRASMHYALEVRSPFLDFRVVEFALNLDEKLKLKNGGKYLLKKVLFNYLPESLFQRPKKGFSIPLQDWLQDDLSFLIDDYLNKALIEKYQIVNFSQVQILIQAFKQGNTNLYNRIWLLISLHMWLENN